MKYLPHVLISVLGPALVLSGCNSKDKNTTTIEWTSFGVPHITADNYTDLGEGLGYVLAKDRLCNYAEGIITVKGERAKFLGAGQDNANIDSDFAYRHIATTKKAADNFDSLDQRTRDLMKGFAAGYNHWLKENKKRPSQCAGYVKDIDHIDVYSLGLSLNYWAFIGNYFGELANAQPDNLTSATAVVNKQLSWVDKMKGSNGWAIGSDMSESGKGMLLSNTHLPHRAKYAWYEAQLTIPKKLNVYGGFLPGFVTPALGFNDTFAWTHTWTAATTGSLYLLRPGQQSTLSYQYGNEEKVLTSAQYTIEVTTAAGEKRSETRTLYNSHYGPIVAFNEDGSMVSIKDAPSQRLDQADYWLKLALSKNVDDAVSLNKQGYRTGSQNIMMTDNSGKTFYADLASVPDLSDQAWVKINQASQTVGRKGLFLDGSDPTFEWQEPVPFEQVPKRYSTHYVQNANEAAWLANIESPIVDYVPLYGKFDYPQSPRTRLSLDLIESFKTSGQKVSLTDLQHVMFHQRLFLAEQIKPDLVSLCQVNPIVYLPTIEQEVDISTSCQVLQQWDNTANLDSVGAHLFREYAFAVYEALYVDQCKDQSCWKTPFDSSDPINTPSGLNTASESVADMHLQALAYATTVIQYAGIPLDATLDTVQQLVKGNKSHDISGGYGDITGSFSTVSVDPAEHIDYLSHSGLTKHGYDINSGDGFIYLAEFNDKGPSAKSMLLYSQSNDPNSTHYFDQANLLSSKEYKEVKFLTSDIKSDKNYKKEKLKIK